MESYIKCLIKACQDIGLDYQFLDREKNFVCIKLNGETLHFQINRTPFNSAVMAGICKDKEHAYLMFKNSIKMPNTIGFLDYTVEERYQKYLTYKSMQEIIDRIEEAFSYPFVIKKNKGSFGINVFLCHNRGQAITSINTIFNKKSNQYDYIALAQDYIPYDKEYRLICFRGEAVLAYERLSDNSKFNARYWETGKGRAKHETDQDIIDNLVSFVHPAFGVKGLEYIGFDILKGKDGNYYLLELNSGPKYDHFIKWNGENAVVAMYKKILCRVLDETK